MIVAWLSRLRYGDSIIGTLYLWLSSQTRTKSAISFVH